MWPVVIFTFTKQKTAPRAKIWPVQLKPWPNETRRSQRTLHGANHVLVPSSKYWVPVLIREGDELGQGIGNKTLISRWPLEVSSQQVFKIKRRRRSLKRKCERNGYSTNDLEPTCLNTLQSWPWLSSGSLKISCERLIAEETCKADLMRKNGIAILFLKKSWPFESEEIVENAREKKVLNSIQYSCFNPC